MEDSLRVSAPPSLRERVADTLRRAIAMGEFEPGERLIERVLCGRLGVSRTSVREALRELENEGLVTNLPNRGLIISKPTRDEAVAIFEARLAIEGLICRLFCEKASEQNRSNLTAALGNLEEAYGRGVPRQMLSAKTVFYDVLLAGANSPVAERMLRSIHIRVSQLRLASLAHGSRKDQSLEEIRCLVQAILSGNPDEAEEQSRTHVRMATECALRRLSGPEPAAP